MSAPPIQFVYVPTVPGLARLFAALAMMMDVFVESQARARAAHKHCPFIDW